jgi:UDP-N-acetylmuramate dehydrogenase
VGGPADLWVVAESKDALEAVAREGKSQGVKLHFFQETHVLVRDGGLDGVWLRLGAIARGVREEDGGLSVGALHPAAALDAYLRENQKGVIPHLAGRAGTVADAFQAGLLDGWVERCCVLRGTRVAELPVEKRSEKQPLIRFLLREQPLPEVDPKGQLALLPEQIQALGRPGRIMSDPDEESAALLIEDTGLSGVRLRGARIGTRERNSLINLGGASAEDIWLVFQMIRDRVKLQTGHVLEVSIRRIGRGMK